MALANSARSVQQVVESSADDPLMRGIEEELALTARRRRVISGPPKILRSKYTFQKYRALLAHELPGARPPPQKALDLLHRLAADPGIVAVMQQEEYDHPSCLNILHMATPVHHTLPDMYCLMHPQCCMLMHALSILPNIAHCVSLT